MIEWAETEGPVAKQIHQVRRDGSPERQQLAQFLGVEDGDDALVIDVIVTVGLDRVRHEKRRELHHPRARVLASFLIQADGDSVRRLEQCGQQETHWSCAEDVHSPAERSGLYAGGTGWLWHPVRMALKRVRLNPA